MAKKIIRLTESELHRIVRESVSKILNICEDIEEGIDFDSKTRTVSYNPSHEDNVDTSIENNPTEDTEIVPNVSVWSIFKRKRGNIGDGNPLIYALKGEGWKFRSDEDRVAIERQINAIVDKFVSLYKVGITVLIPSGSRNNINQYIADIILSKVSDAEVLNGVILKLTTAEVDRIVLYDDNCQFRQVYKDDFNTAYEELHKYLDLMNKERDGYFSRHFVFNDKMRNVLDKTFKLSDDYFAKYANKINDQNILIIDDTISRGQSIKEACQIMMESYAPKSITVLTLLSKLC